MENIGKFLILNKWKKLGKNIEEGEAPQVLVEKGCIFGSAMNNDGYALVGCMVSPSFQYDEFELFKRDDLLELYPNYSRLATFFQYFLRKNQKKWRKSQKKC